MAKAIGGADGGKGATELVDAVIDVLAASKDQPKQAHQIYGPANGIKESLHTISTTIYEPPELSCQKPGADSIDASR